MPYRSNSELNASIKKAHPTQLGQTAFRKTFNAVLKDTGNETTAFKEAHASADKVESKRRGTK
jgi:cation transport regulator ChaB